MSSSHRELDLGRQPPEPPPSQWRKLLAVAFGPQIAAWRGQAPLAHVFWGQGVFVSVALILVYVDALYRHDQITEQVMLTLFQVYSIWVLVAIWRCAANAKPPWGVIARLLTIAWAVNTMLIAGFLQLDLLFR